MIELLNATDVLSWPTMEKPLDILTSTDCMLYYSLEFDILLLTTDGILEHYLFLDLVRTLLT